MANLLAEQEDGIDATVIFWIIRHLGILSPHYFAACGNHAQLRDIDLNDGTLGDDPKGCVHGARGISLRADDGQIERGLQLGVRDVGLFETETHGTDETLEFGRLPGESFGNERDLKKREINAPFL